jgi:hypothetical protein
MCPNERCVNSDKLEGFIQNRWKLISCHWRPVEMTIKGTRMILLQTDILFQQHDRTCWGSVLYYLYIAIMPVLVSLRKGYS